MTDEMKREIAAIFRKELVKMQEADHRLALAVVRLDGRMDRFGDRLSSTATKDDVDRIIGHIVAFTKDIEAARRDRALSSSAYMRHQDCLDDHEKRLTRLESKRS